MKGKKTEFAGNPCPIARTLGIIGDWWSLLIIRDALEGPQRFGELQRNLGMAKNILATRLRKPMPIIAGQLNKQTAVDLGIVEKTIKVHRARMMEKMKVHSVAELVRLAEKAGIEKK